MIQSDTVGSPLQPAVPIDHDYDLNDNRILMDDNLTGATTYLPDSLNRTGSLTNPSSDQIDFGYDALGRPLRRPVIV